MQGHKYFHIGTGNRVTCRDWFQVCWCCFSLKMGNREALGVMRERRAAERGGAGDDDTCERWG